MTQDTIKHKEFIKRYAEKMGCNEETAKEYLEGFMNTLFDAMKNRESVTLEHLGKF